MAHYHLLSLVLIHLKSIYSTCNVQCFFIQSSFVWYIIFLFHHDKFIYPLLNLSPPAIQTLTVNKLLLLLWISRHVLLMWNILIYIVYTGCSSYTEHVTNYYKLKVVNLTSLRHLSHCHDALLFLRCIRFSFLGCSEEKPKNK